MLVIKPLNHKTFNITIFKKGNPLLMGLCSILLFNIILSIAEKSPRLQFNESSGITKIVLFTVFTNIYSAEWGKPPFGFFISPTLLKPIYTKQK